MSDTIEHLGSAYPVEKVAPGDCGPLERIEYLEQRVAKLERMLEPDDEAMDEEARAVFEQRQHERRERWRKRRTESGL